MGVVAGALPAIPPRRRCWRPRRPRRAERARGLVRSAPRAMSRERWAALTPAARQFAVRPRFLRRGGLGAAHARLSPRAAPSNPRQSGRTAGDSRRRLPSGPGTPPDSRRTHRRARRTAPRHFEHAAHGSAARRRVGAPLPQAKTQVGVLVVRDPVRRIESERVFKTGAGHDHGRSGAEVDFSWKGELGEVGGVAVPEDVRVGLARHERAGLLHGPVEVELGREDGAHPRIRRCARGAAAAIRARRAHRCSAAGGRHCGSVGSLIRARPEPDVGRFGSARRSGRRAVAAPRRRRCRR